MLTYTGMLLNDTFLSRFRYLVLGGELGVATFGYDRYLNQQFYASAAWKEVRDFVILRDDGCDLGIPDRKIHDRVLVHHMNPIQVKDLLHFNPDILDPEYLICVTTRTHNAIHFGNELQLDQPMVERSAGDHLPWRSF